MADPTPFGPDRREPDHREPDHGAANQTGPPPLAEASGANQPVAGFLEIDSLNVDGADDDVRWRFEPDFLRSNWTCIWDRGCHGIADVADAPAQLGCCSVGAEMVNTDEAMAVSALAAMVDAKHFQFHDVAQAGGVLNDNATNTRVVDGACIFLNRPGFSGGAGCALHHAAVAADEPAWEWKPEVCWELPVKVDWDTDQDGRPLATVRRWSRKDWGADGETMAWCCTDPADGGEAYIGETTVIESLAGELSQMVGAEVVVELRRRLDEPPQQ